MFLEYVSDAEAPADVPGHLTRSGPPVVTSRRPPVGSPAIPGISLLNSLTWYTRILLVATGGPDLVRCPVTTAGAPGALICPRYITYNI